MKETLFAFWEYDQPPYFLGGTITKMYEDGTVETKEYGRGNCFTPVKIVPAQAGRAIKAKLDEIREKTNDGVSNLKHKAYKEARDLIK